MRVFFLVPPEVQLLDITGPAHLFYEARAYHANMETHYLAMEATYQQKSSAGLVFSNLIPFSHFLLGPEDVLFVPGLESHLFFAPDFSKKHTIFFKWLRDQYDNGTKICSVCTGAYILGFAGLLNEKECTTHWKYFEDFGNRFSKAKLLQDRLLIKDGNLYSSAGVSSGIDLALFVLEEMFGAVFVSKIAKEVVIYLRRSPSDPQLSVFLQYRNHIETRIHKIQDILAQNLDQKMILEDLAHKVYMSPRNLTRLFKKTTGTTIGQYLEELRVEKAVQLLSQGEKVMTVSAACGLRSTNHLRTLLKKHTSLLPSEFMG
nr:helix-turn-helix domain-containing protein [uncultured Allomuricauda sp.]